MINLLLTIVVKVMDNDEVTILTTELPIITIRKVVELKTLHSSL